MGVENADDAATWKATMSILRRQKLLPLLEGVDACEEEDIIISIMIILCLSCSFAFRSRIQAGGEQSDQDDGVVRGRDGGFCVVHRGRCVFKFVQ